MKPDICDCDSEADIDTCESFDRYPCGCLKNNISCFSHWLKYTRIRLFFRSIAGWRVFIWWNIFTRWEELKCNIRAYLIPIQFSLGAMSMYDAVDFENRWKEHASNWVEIRRQFLFLYADAEHPDGVYAKSGFDIIPMTSDEHDHWHGNKIV